MKTLTPLPSLLLAFLLAAGCGSGSTPTGGALPPATYDTGRFGADSGPTEDGAPAVDSGAPGAGSVDAGGVDGGALEAGDTTGDAATAAETSGIDDAFFDPPDLGPQDSGEPGPPPSLFAHTKDKLYALDPVKSAMVEVGAFSFDQHKGLVTDIALDQYRNLYAITFEDLFSCDPETAACTWVAKLPAQFNGLTFIPISLVPGSKTEALIGISEQGDWTWIRDNGKGGMTMQKLGSYGGGWRSSGDAFSVVGIGTFATLKKKSGGMDSLASIDPKTGQVLKVIGSTGVAGLFGFAWWGDVFYGFSNNGKVYVVDVATGKATEALNITTPKGVQWWGAGVSTRANGP